MTRHADTEIRIDYMSRVEGETNLIVSRGPESLVEVRLDIFEPPRFFEGFMVGRKYDEVGDITSRICGICPISHMTTAIQAVEAAMGIDPSPQTRKIRRLMCVSQNVASHVIHLYMLALPDYFGYQGFLPMIPDFPQEAEEFLAMKSAMNRVAAVIGGRALHPISMVVGGFTRIPTRADLDDLAGRIREVLPLARRTIDRIHGLSHPELHSDSEYLALRTGGEFAVNHGRIVSSKGLDLESREYLSFFREKQESYAMAKKSFTREGDTFMVGALARMNMKSDQYQEETRKIMEEKAVAVPDTNPFHNNLAQAFEIYDGMLECLRLLDEIHPRQEAPMVRVRDGEGLAVTEAPRGLLMHFYGVDKKGTVRKANLVTPTSHNFANMEKDLLALVTRFPDEDELGDLRLKCAQLVRAYDPCFSCSVH
jgi:coenzyme F420-reducing hydrogenase alpha subunit